MERVKIKTGEYFEGIPESVPAENDEKRSFEWSDVSEMMSEALIVLDFQKRNLQYVSPHHLCLCGLSPEKAKELGYDFFNDALHPEDLTLWRDIHRVILKNLYSDELPKERIIYFGCALRFKSFLSEEVEKPDYLMVYMKIKPIFQDGIPIRGICLIAVDPVPQSGSLSVRYDNGDEATYSFTSRKWITKPFAPLTKRQKQVLVLRQQGDTNDQIAKKLFLSIKAIEMTKSSLFIEENTVEWMKYKPFTNKNQYANNRCLIYQNPSIDSKRGGKRPKK